MKRTIIALTAALVATQASALTLDVERVDVETFKSARYAGKAQAKATVRLASNAALSSVIVTCAFLDSAGSVIGTGANGVVGIAANSYARTDVRASISAGASVASTDCRARGF